MRHHKVIEADHEPDLPSVARLAPGQTPSAAPQGRDQPTQGAIPAFHKSCLDCLPELPEAHLLAKTARATEDHASAHLHDMARLVADLHDLRIEPVCGGHEPWCGLAAHLPTTSRRYTPPTSQQRRRRGLPPVREKERYLLRARDDLRDQRGRRVLGPRAEVDPQEEPAPHGNAVWIHVTRRGRSFAWASSNWPPCTSTCCTTC